MVEAAGHDSSVAEDADMVAQPVAEAALAKLGGTHIRPVEHIPRLQKYPRRKAQAAPELLPRLWEAPRKLRAYAGIQRLEAAGIPQP